MFRNIQTSFWTDAKVVDTFTPEDKYFMLFILTNQYTNLIGCYEISIRQMSNDLGYSRESVENLLKRFIEIHKVIEYDFETKEIFIKNWSKYNWSKSPKLDKPLLQALKTVKSLEFKQKLAEIYNKRDTVSIPYVYGMDTSITITNTITNTISNSITITISKIIEILNKKLNSKFTTKNKATIRHIKARLSEGYTIEDFEKVINKKYEDWHGTEMQKYLRPETLFGTKFESYLNEPEKVKKQGNMFFELLKEEGKMK